MANLIKGVNGVVTEVIDGDTGSSLQLAGGTRYDLDSAKVATFSDPSGTVKVGDTYEAKEIEYAVAAGLNKAMLTALFQVVNDVRGLKAQTPLTATQFKTFIKGMIT